jgi:hypothetical protein
MREWPSMERPIRAPKQLLVEGRTAEIFFREWIQRLGVGVDVRDYGSIGDLTNYLKDFTSRPEFREGVNSMAIIRDAEDNPAESAFASVCSSLGAVGIACPIGAGLFSTAEHRAGVFILPDCNQPGMLETLCWSVLEANPTNAPHLECVDEYLACVRNAGVEIKNETKARIWTYLAGWGRFDPQVGRAARANAWDWDSPALTKLSTFLKTL